MAGGGGHAGHFISKTQGAQQVVSNCSHFSPRKAIQVTTFCPSGPHPNDGDVRKQAALDSALLASVQITFAALLDAVFEQPEKRKKTLSALKAARGTLKGSGPN